MRGTSADDVVSISQGPRQIYLYRTLPFKPISLMSAIHSGFGDMRNNFNCCNLCKGKQWKFEFTDTFMVRICTSPCKLTAFLSLPRATLRSLITFDENLERPLLRASPLKPHTCRVCVGTPDIPKLHDFMLAHFKYMLACLGFDSIFEIV